MDRINKILRIISHPASFEILFDSVNSVSALLLSPQKEKTPDKICPASPLWQAPSDYPRLRVISPSLLRSEWTVFD